MPSNATPSKTRDVDNVLLRLPARIRQAVASTANASQLPQNTIYAAAALQWTISHGVVPAVGRPQNLLNLIDEIDAALKDGFPVVGAFQRHDWVDVQSFLEMLDAGGVISDFRSKPDVKAPATIVYAFMLSKVGRLIWRDMSIAIRAAIQERYRQEIAFEGEHEGFAGRGDGSSAVEQ